jgi:hypothetical protein
MVSNLDNKRANKLTPVMKEVLESLLEDPKTDSELLKIIPNFSLEILGKLREIEAIDHNDHLVYVTSIGKKLLNNEKLNI